MTDSPHTGLIHAGFIVAELLIFLGACAWVFIRLENIENKFGSFDLYWQILLRAAPLQLLTLAAYVVLRGFA